MGYKRQRGTYRLTFDEYPELEVEIRRLSLDDLLEAGPRIDQIIAGGLRTKEEIRAAVRFLCEYFQSWSMEEEDGTPVPATYDELVTEDPRMIFAILVGWAKAIHGAVGSPLPGASPNGLPSTAVSPDRSAEALIPMDEIPETESQPS